MSEGNGGAPPCVGAVVEPWLQRLLDDRVQGTTVGVPRLMALLAELPDPADWIDRACFDPAVPYGRTIVVAEDGLEVMVAGWSRGRPCAPHDHGPGQGAVRVLQGRARHRELELERGRLRRGVDEELEAGAVLGCRRGWIHQMQDDGAALPLVTLHVYVGPTSPMTVYDVEHERTQWLDSSCGAWPRALEDAEVLAWAPGFKPRQRAPFFRRQLLSPWQPL